MPSNNTKSLKNFVYASLFTVLIIIGTFISIPLPLSPVPIVLANLFVLLAGLLLGPQWGSTSVAIYLLLGLIGLPVFSKGGSGFVQFAGPTGGFLIGYLVCAFVTGFISHKGKENLIKDIVAIIIGLIVIYACGVPWLKIVLDVTWGKAVALAMLPFLIGDTLKAVAAVTLIKILRPVMKHITQQDDVLMKQDSAN